MVGIKNWQRHISRIEGRDSYDAYTNLSSYLAKRIERDRLMMSYAKKKGHSINSKKGRKPRITYVTFDNRDYPVAVTLWRCPSRRYLDGVRFNKRFKPAR